jgi:hypothetical protein
MLKMENPDKNRLLMFRTVKTVLDVAEYKTIWQTLPAYVTDYGEFSRELEELQDLAMPLNKRGATAEKGDEKAALVDLAYTTAAAILAYAEREGLSGLAARVSFTRYEIQSGRDIDTAARARQVLAAAVDYVDKLADYRVDAAKIEELKATISAFETAALRPRFFRATGKTQTREIKERTNRIERILTYRLDGLTESFFAAHPRFVNDYRNARIVHDVPATRGSEEEPAATPVGEDPTAPSPEDESDPTAAAPATTT